MTTISIPLVQTADGRITYAGDASKWIGAHIVGDKLVGDYTGALFAGNGTTKLFGWSYSNNLGEDEVEQLKNKLRDDVQDHLDAQAQSMGYDNIGTAVTYADEPSVAKFQAEGQALRAWRSLVWDACYAILNDVLTNVRPVPTAGELIAELPDFVPPGT